jgi:hypothetical protein
VTRRHFPIKAATIASQALCGLMAALWLFSYWRYINLNRIHADLLIGASIRAGNLVLVHESSAMRIDPIIRWDFRIEPPDSSHREGFNRGIIRGSNKRLGITSMLVYIPLWLCFVVFALLPFYRAVITFLTRRRIARGRCPTCSYSLTGNKSGVCPECGTAIHELSHSPGYLL